MNYARSVLILVGLLFVFACSLGPQMNTSLDDEAFLEKLANTAYAEMDNNGEHYPSLAEPYQTVAIIYSAQGIIDNGGFVYFFENDWPNNPPYSLFADAYERIGRTNSAAAIRNAARSFGVPNPERNLEMRRAYINENYNEETHSVDGWNDCICGDEKIWSDLASWARAKL